jgi:syringomycin synthetase protein SyrE
MTARPHRLPLTLAQREVLLDQRAFPDSPHLLLGGCALLRGPIDPTLLQRGLHALVREQAALRLREIDLDGQTLLPPEAPPPDLIVRPPGDPDHPWDALHALWRAWSRAPLDLAHDLPWRMACIPFGPALHGLLLFTHHAVMDGWGTAQFMRRWSAWVQALHTGTEPDPEDGDALLRHIDTSQAYLAGPAFAADARHWAERFPSAPPPLLPPSAAATLPPALTARTQWSRERQAAWAALAAPEGQTEFATLLAALAVHCTRLAGVDEVVIGVPTLNRPGKTHRQAVGMYVGVMPLRLRPEPHHTARQLVRQVGAQLLSGLRHSRYPASQLARDLHLLAQGRTSLFDVLLSFERQDYQLRFGHAQLTESQQLFSGWARFPLSLTVCDFGPEQQLHAIAEGSAQRHDARGLELLLRRLAHVADQMAAQPDAPLAALHLLDPLERAAVLDDPHRDLAQLDDALPVVQRVAQQAALLPDATALVWDGGQQSYAALWQRVEALAAALLQHGVTTGRVVALALPRGPALVQAQLAVGRAGGAFLPLDLDAPNARLQACLALAHPAVVVADPDDTARWSTLGWPTLAVDAPAPALAPRWPAWPAEDAPAYWLFTSGSTGTPKAVVVPQGALARRLAWMARAWSVGPSDRSLQTTQPTFDPSLIELLLPLTQGGSVALPPAGRLDPERLAPFAVRHGCTLAALVPTTLRRLLDGLRTLPPTERRRLRLRLVCCGGEVLPPELAQAWLRDTDAALWNVYGPTEACILASAWLCRPSDTGPLPLGQPVDDARLYVLDALGEPLPYGAEGDIWIGGRGLALGYAGDDARTAEAFRPDPFATAPGARMYRTGDRGWWDGEGRLHFAGRADRQIKLRGLRIEPGDVEAALMALPGVAEAHVAGVRDGERLLLQAWVAPDTLAIAALQAALRQRLPDALVPSRWTLLPALPRTPVGKVDAAALPTNGQRAPARAPRTALEATLLDLLREALHDPALGVDDDFFVSGGDSLAALDWLASIEARTGLRPSLALLTQAPSVAQLATALAAEGAPGPLAARPSGPVRLGLPLSEAPGRPLLALAASGHGDLLRFQALAQHLHPDLAVHMLQPSQDLVQAGPQMDALAEAYADHLQALQRQTQPAALVLAGFSVGGVAALETAQRLRQRGVAVQAVVLIDSVYPRWLLRQGWLWRGMGWLARRLAVQELTMNGRRLGAMFTDPGLHHQVMALRAHRLSPVQGPVLLIRTSGLARWQRWLFGPWQARVGHTLTVADIPGLHGSIFEPARLPALAEALRRATRPSSPAGHTSPHG